MAKKKTQRERPTLTTVRELRAYIDTLQRQVSRSTALLTDIQKVDAQVLDRAIKQADAFTESRGLLHSVLDENPTNNTALANRIRRFLGRPELPIASSVQRLLEAHASASESLQLAN